MGVDLSAKCDAGLRLGLAEQTGKKSAMLC